jgi:hypothetical protein
MDIIGILILYPLGMLVLWIKNKRKKSVKEIYNEYEYYEVRGEGVVLLLNLIAGTGAITLSIFVLCLIGFYCWRAIQSLF